MKKLFLLLIVYCCGKAASAQLYWQQQVNYRIDVTLTDATHTLDGFEKINYTNNPPDNPALYLVSPMAKRFPER